MMPQRTTISIRIDFFVLSMRGLSGDLVLSCFIIISPSGPYPCHPFRLINNPRNPGAWVLIRLCLDLGVLNLGGVGMMGYV